MLGLAQPTTILAMTDIHSGFCGFIVEETEFELMPAMLECFVDDSGNIVRRLSSPDGAPLVDKTGLSRLLGWGSCNAQCDSGTFSGSSSFENSLESGGGKLMRKFLLTAAALSVIASATATAQNSSPDAPGNGTAGVNDTMGSPATQGGAMGANPAAMAPANAPKMAPQPVPTDKPNFMQVLNSNMLSSNVVGLDIYDAQQTKIGKIQDVAFNASKQVTGYILSVGGFLGMGAHYVAVDPASVMVQYDARKNAWRASMNATKDELKAAPEFKYSGQWTASRS